MSSVLDFPVAQYGPFLATRGSAKAARENLENSIRGHDRVVTVRIRFDGVEAMTISFADEFLGRFYSSMAAGDVTAAGVLLSGFNEETHEAVAICLDRRDLIAVAAHHGETILMGRSEPVDAAFRAALQLGEFRATDLAAALSITPQNANNRLKRLVGAGAVQRRQASVSNRGGKEFVYTAMQATP